MKNARIILFLSIALLLSIGAHVLVSLKGGVDSKLVRRTSLFEGDPSSLKRIEISRPGEPLTVIEKSGRWALSKPYRASADERSVLRILDSLASSEIEEAIGDGELLKLGRSRSDFDLEDGKALRITVIGDDDTRSSLYFGTATPSGDGVYACVDGDDAVYVVQSNAYANANLSSGDFRNRSVFAGVGGAIVAFDLKRASGPFMRFVRDGENWLMREPSVAGASAAKIGKLLSGISQASASEFLWPVGTPGEPTDTTASLLASYGLDPESATTLTFKFSDGTDSQISFGKAASGGLVYALVQNAGAIVTLDGALKEQALSGVAEFTDTRLFPFDSAAVAKLSINDGDITYLLAKTADGTWRLDAPIAAPADSKFVNEIIEKTVTLKSADQTEGPGTIGVSVDAAPQACVRRAAVLGEESLDALRSPEIMKIDRSRVKRLVVNRVGDKTTFSTSVVFDKDRRTWNVERSNPPGTIIKDSIDEILSALEAPVAKKIVKIKVSSADLKACGLESPRLTIAVDQDRDDAVRKNLLIGGDTGDGGFYATLGATDAIFVLDAATVHKLAAPVIEN